MHHDRKLPFKGLDWDDVDFDQRLGQDVVLPDGRLFHLELEMICWYWVTLMAQNDRSLDSVIQDALAVLAEDGEPWDDAELTELIRIGIISYGQEWIKTEMGKPT